jgi:transcriptional regulator with XRE-family HTH domain
MPKKKLKSKVFAIYGNKLLQLRKYFAFTQEKMAAIMKITLSSYKKNELGKHLMSTSSLIALHNRLGISLEWLLFDRGLFFACPEPVLVLFHTAGKAMSM